MWLALPLVLASTTVAAASEYTSPWNGNWRIDAARSRPGVAEDAAPDYRFLLGRDGSIRWEIPSLKEVVEGRTDGQPMPIRRPGAEPGMSLAVTAATSRVLIYRVLKDGVVRGEGRMTLIDGGRAWIDIVWPAGHPETARCVVYVKA